MTTPDGQLSPQERDALRAAVVRHQPRLVLEVGTWKGGGSTAQIASALLELGRGALVTCEMNPEFHAEAEAYYASSPYAGIVTTYLGKGAEVIEEILFGNRAAPGFIFFDGGEEPQEVLDDFLALDRLILPGAVFMMHDWLNPESRKSLLIRPYLEASSDWRIVSVLGPPVSVGLVEAVKL